MTKKGQTEIVGLIFIVLFVIIVGTVFLIVFIRPGEADFSRSEIKSSLLANKFISTITQTQVTDCSRRNIQSIVRDYFEGDEFCYFDDSSVAAKDYLADNVFGVILENIFEKRGNAYNFTVIGVKAGESEVFYSREFNFENDFNAVRRAAPYRVPLTNPNDYIEFQLVVKTN